MAGAFRSGCGSVRRDWPPAHQWELMIGASAGFGLKLGGGGLTPIAALFALPLRTQDPKRPIKVTESGPEYGTAGGCTFLG